MHRVTRDEYPIDTLHRLVNGVTFFKELIQADPSQFELLMSVTEFHVADEGEVILHKNDPANELYFLLKGQLTVYPDDEHHDRLNDINPGEMLGVMAMLLNNRRSASIEVSSKTALLARIDYQYFRDLTDFSLFTLTTKIRFFRMLANHIRWNLELNKMQTPMHPLLARLRSIPLVSAPKETLEELTALHAQSTSLAQLLSDWNSTPAALDAT